MTSPTDTEPEQWQTEPDDAEYDPAPHGDGPTRLAGDRHDDDGQVLDSLVQPAERDADDPAPQAGAPEVATVPSRITGPRPVTRLRTETTVLADGGEPYRIVSRNADRVRMQVKAFGVGRLYLSDDPSRIVLAMGAFQIQASPTTVLDLDEHTGPLFCRAVGGEISVTFVEVTK